MDRYYLSLPVTSNYRLLDSDSQKSIDRLDERCDCQLLVTAIVGQDEADILVEGQQNSTGYLLEGELT